jgi:hypothetical protein
MKKHDDNKKESKHNRNQHAVDQGQQACRWRSDAERRTYPLSLRSTIHHTAFAVQGRQVFSLHFAHSKMNQCGPEWHMLQFQRMRVVSDLIILKACSHFPGFAIWIICQHDHGDEVLWIVSLTLSDISREVRACWKIRSFDVD